MRAIVLRSQKLAKGQTTEARFQRDSLLQLLLHSWKYLFIEIHKTTVKRTFAIEQILI